MSHRSSPPSASRPGSLALTSLLSVMRLTPAMTQAVPTFRREPIREAMSDDAPRDCVREFPTLSADVVELVSFDWEGHPRFKLAAPAGEDLDSWETLLLRRTRRLFPAPRATLRIIG